MVIWSYLRKHWIVYGMFLAYGSLIVLNALGFGVWLPFCPIKAASGIECLGCGINRAAIALLKMDFQGAALHNPLIFVYIPLILILISFHFYRYWSKLNRNNH
jgi:hypothetical protein